jgi:hypothetical protein
VLIPGLAAATASAIADERAVERIEASQASVVPLPA